MDRMTRVARAAGQGAVALLLPLILSAATPAAPVALPAATTDVPAMSAAPATPAMPLAPSVVRGAADSVRGDGEGSDGARRAVHTIVVDAGHGGPDRGMSGPIGGSGPRLVEKDITLSVAIRTAAELRKRGHRVVMTRTTDTLIALGDRGAIANRANGDLFMSIHVNAANPQWKSASSARGFETYFLAEAKTEDARRVADMENASEQYETSVEVGKGNPLSFILADMKQNEHLRESSALAGIVQRKLASVHPGPNRGVKQAGFKVLVTAFMPSVLVELGFGTNPSEAAYLRSAAEQLRIASALADAAEAYLAEYDRRSGAATR